MPKQQKCPLCDRVDVTIERAQNRDAYICECSVCGRFLFTAEAAYALATEENKPRRYILSTLTIRASTRREPLELLSRTVTDLLEKTTAPRTPWDVLEPLLLAIHDQTTGPLATVELPYTDYSRFFLRKAEDLGDFLDLLSRLDLIDLERDPANARYFARLTLQGWERVAELRKSGKTSARAFVAMSFAEELDSAYDNGFAPALLQTGWTPIRMDRLQHNQRIDDLIVAERRRAGMVVADFTGNRPGVYFEAGRAAGLGIPVIWTVKDTDLASVHFDTRQYNHIVWTTPEDLQAQLKARVIATVQPPGI
ncbi:MAG TPA: hypothetical protein VFI79_11790 [Gemmatimonadales bacterium]|nr:hypothetical protein [Gemmatimonadales bacterium]